jgi:hypothetical protein
MSPAAAKREGPPAPNRQCEALARMRALVREAVALNVAGRAG